jgi:phosphoglycerate dehydrogenase-like enzyme
VTRTVLANATKLIAVGAFCIGTNLVDLAVSADEGIAVSLTRRSPTPEAWSSWL